jgi:hypothetical protein
VSAAVVLLVSFAAATARADDAAPPAPVTPASGDAAPVAHETAAAGAPASRWDWAAFPIVFYAPETSLGFAAGVAFFDDSPKPRDRPRLDDNIALSVQGTLKKQFALGVSLAKYFDDDRYQLTEDATLASLPAVYWGLGNDTPETASESFTQRGAVSRLTFTSRVVEALFVGAGISAGFYDIDSIAAGGVASYAVTQAAPERGGAVGVGPVLRRDTRDDAMGAHSGSLTVASATFFPSFLGGAYRYEYYELDQRTHVSIGARSVLAMAAYGAWAPGHVPLSELPALGGSQRMRGYYLGRFRDHLYVMGQLEWRVRVVGRFSVAPFAGVGNVFSSLSAMSFDHTKVAGGLALRLNLKKERDLNVHLDIAKSPISSGLYLNLGEAF